MFMPTSNQPAPRSASARRYFTGSLTGTCLTLPVQRAEGEISAQSSREQPATEAKRRRAQRFLRPRAAPSLDGPAERRYRAADGRLSAPGLTSAGASTGNLHAARDRDRALALP